MTIVLLFTSLLCSVGLEALEIVRVSALRFPEQVAGITQDVQVGTSDEGASVFNMTGGEPGATFTLSISEQNVNINNGGYSVLVDTFRVSGPSIFDGSGNAYNIKVGATAHIGASAGSGNYYGSATLLVTLD